MAFEIKMRKYYVLYTLMVEVKQISLVFSENDICLEAEVLITYTRISPNEYHFKKKEV